LLFARRHRFPSGRAGGGENAERDRQIEAAGLLRQVGRREVDREFSGWEIELRVLQRGASVAQPTSVTIRMRFVDYNGPCVMHCRMLPREYLGMMQAVIAF
jgi:FtsP/CotA-like multicopper oxidase with cupredoxin domain